MHATAKRTSMRCQPAKPPGSLGSAGQAGQDWAMESVMSQCIGINTSNGRS